MGALKKEAIEYYNYNNYCSWSGDWELINGIAYSMAPAPVIRHQEISLNISLQLKRKLKECKKCKALMEVDYRVNDYTILRPDVLVACEVSKDAKYIEKTPKIIFEVLSPSTKIKDRSVKFHIYQEEKVKYLILVEPQNEFVEIYKLSPKEVYVLDRELKDENYQFEFDECVIDFEFNTIWEE